MNDAARQSPDHGPPNKKRDIVTKFIEEYSDVIVAGQIQMEHTSTEGWLHLYSGMRTIDIESRLSIAKAMAEFSQTVKDPTVFTHLDDLKPIGEFKKRLTEHMTMMGNWRSQTVDPVRKCVDDAHGLIRKYRRDAEEIERQNALIHSGLLGVMEQAMDEMPTLDWDEKTGRVNAIPPKKPKSE